MGGKLLNNPYPVLMPDGSSSVFGIGTNHHLYQGRWDTAGQFRWIDLGALPETPVPHITSNRARPAPAGAT
jgi:hypothetical protein